MMASKVTSEDIVLFNSLYYKTKNFSEVARQTGFSASTVRKYVDKNWQPVVAENIKHFDASIIPDFERVKAIFCGRDNYGELCTLTEREQQEIAELWKELVV